MAMTIGEANSAAILLRALTGDARDVDPAQLVHAMRDLDARASKVLQLRVVSSDAAIEAAAAGIAQRHADSLGGAA